MAVAGVVYNSPMVNRRSFLASLLAIPVVGPAVKPFAKYVCGVDLAAPGTDATVVASYVAGDPTVKLITERIHRALVEMEVVLSRDRFLYGQGTPWKGFPPVVEFNPEPGLGLNQAAQVKRRMRTKFDPARLPA